MADDKDPLWELAAQFVKRKNNYGYLIPELIPSKPLYRYRSNIDRAIDEIQNSYIYLSSITKLNDPFDSSYIVSFEEAKEEKNTGKYFYEKCYFLKKTEWYDTVGEELKNSCLYEKNLPMVDFFNQLAPGIKKHGGRYVASIMMDLFYEQQYSFVQHNYGYSASFSEKYDNILMWSYYADSHKGVCLGYDLSKLDPDDSEQKAVFSSIKKVWYSSERYNDRDGSYTPFVKAQEWSHEQEWRLFNKTTEGKIKFPCLSSIYLGMNFDIESDAFYQIVSAIKNSAQVIDLYVCHPDISTYTINPIKIIL